MDILRQLLLSLFREKCSCMLRGEALPEQTITSASCSTTLLEDIIVLIPFSVTTDVLVNQVKVLQAAKPSGVFLIAGVGVVKEHRRGSSVEKIG